MKKVKNPCIIMAERAGEAAEAYPIGLLVGAQSSKYIKYVEVLNDSLELMG